MSNIGPEEFLPLKDKTGQVSDCNTAVVGLMFVKDCCHLGKETSDIGRTLDNS